MEGKVVDMAEWKRRKESQLEESDPLTLELIKDYWFQIQDQPQPEDDPFGGVA